MNLNPIIYQERVNTRKTFVENMQEINNIRRENTARGSVLMLIGTVLMMLIWYNKLKTFYILTIISILGMLCSRFAKTQEISTMCFGLLLVTLWVIWMVVQFYLTIVIGYSVLGIYLIYIQVYKILKLVPYNLRFPGFHYRTYRMVQYKSVKDQFLGRVDGKYAGFGTEPNYDNSFGFMEARAKSFKTALQHADAVDWIDEHILHLVETQNQYMRIALQDVNGKNLEKDMLSSATQLCKEMHIYLAKFEHTKRMAINKTNEVILRRFGRGIKQSSYEVGILNSFRWLGVEFGDGDTLIEMLLSLDKGLHYNCSMCKSTCHIWFNEGVISQVCQCGSPASLKEMTLWFRKGLDPIVLMGMLGVKDMVLGVIVEILCTKILMNMLYIKALPMEPYSHGREMMFVADTRYRVLLRLATLTLCGIDCDPLCGRMMRVPIDSWLVTSLMNMVLSRSMCVEGCVCISKEYGDELNQELQQLKPKIDANIFKTYGECNAALSHCWGDKLLLNRSGQVLKNVSNLLYINDYTPWLDIAQDYFEAALAKQEYTDIVIILAKPIYEFGHLMTDKEIVNCLLLSDWAQRGWTAQEVQGAHSTMVMCSNEIRKVELSLVGSLAVQMLGIKSDQSDQDYYISLLSRKWRRREDLIKTSEWWSQDPNILEKLLKATLVSSYPNNNRQSCCWLPTQYEGLNVHKIGIDLELDASFNCIMKGHYKIMDAAIIWRHLKEHGCNGGGIATLCMMASNHNTMLVVRIGGAYGNAYSLTQVVCTENNKWHIVGGPSIYIMPNKPIDLPWNAEGIVIGYITQKQ